MLDEPSMGLAPLLVKHVFACIKELNHHGLTLFLTEQEIAAYLDISTRGYVLQLIQIVLEGSGTMLLEIESVKRIYLGGKS